MPRQRQQLGCGDETGETCLQYASAGCPSIALQRPVGSSRGLLLLSPMTGPGAQVGRRRTRLGPGVPRRRRLPGQGGLHGVGFGGAASPESPTAGGARLLGRCRRPPPHSGGCGRQVETVVPTRASRGPGCHAEIAAEEFSEGIDSDRHDFAEA